MSENIYLRQNVTCDDCGFSTRDVALFNNHSCDIQENGGTCEDFPCCGHEYGDCNGQKYGSDEAIKAYAMEHVYCDHEAGWCDAWEDDPEDD